MPKPNFFIVGAAKCGTTALHVYLAGHPNIFMSESKEPCWFCKDLAGHCKVNSYEEYLELFANATDEHRFIGESSPFYIYSQDAIENIREFAPDAKIVVMFRNPVEQVPSFHNQARYDATEEVDDLEAAWALQESRANGENIPKWCYDPPLLQYRALASFGAQYERLLRVFPKEQVLLILMDDFKRDSTAVYRRVLEFLGLPDDGRSNFEPVNESHEHLIPALGRWLAHPPPILLKLNSLVKRVLGLESTGFRHMAAVTKPRAAVSPEFTEMLRRSFREDVAKLEALSGHDLGHWCGPTTQETRNSD